MSEHAAAAGDSGRGSNGKFTEGNRFGKGNPHAKLVNDLRTALLNAVSVDDMKAIITALVKKAKEGDVPAAREVLERCLGKPIESDLLERLEQLEQQLAKANEQ